MASRRVRQRSDLFLVINDFIGFMRCLKLELLIESISAIRGVRGLGCFAEWPCVLLRKSFAHFHTIERADFALRLHRKRSGGAGSLAEGR